MRRECLLPTCAREDPGWEAGKRKFIREEPEEKGPGFKRLIMDTGGNLLHQQHEMREGDLVSSIYRTGKM